MNVTPICPARLCASRPRGRSLGPLIASLCVALAGSASAQTISVQPEAPTGLSRGELVIGQAVGGLLDGALFCVATECDSSQSFAAAALLSTSASLGIGMLTFPHGVTPGQAAAVNAGTWIGTWNGLAFAGLVDASDGKT